MLHSKSTKLRTILLIALLAMVSGVTLINHANVLRVLESTGLLKSAAAETLYINADVAATTVPGVFNYQGVVRDADGSPLANGEYNMTFRVYDSIALGATKWDEAHNGVTVRDGRFGVTLGTFTAIPATLFHDSADRFVGVTVEGYAEMQPRLRLASVPYAFQAEHADHATLADNATTANFAQDAKDGVPVGAVIDWWRPDPSFSLPDGYLVCNGATVNDPASPLHGKTLPNLLDRFVRGVTDVTQIGTTGGNEVHSHNVSVPVHSHNATIPAKNLTTNGPSTNSSYTIAGSGLARADHTHEVNIPATTIDTTSYTFPQLTTAPGSSLPSYIGLLKLCRIK